MTSQALQVETNQVAKQGKRLKSGPVLGTLRFLFRSFGPIAPRQMGRLAYRLWFTPRRIPRPDREKSILQIQHEQYKVMGHGNEVLVRAWGKGPTVLMVHGWEGRGTQFSHFIESLLGQGMRVAVFDMPGHGDSDGKQTDLVEIEKVISQIELREGDLHAVVSHSFGGVAAAFAFRKGLQASRAVFINPPSRFKTMLHFFQNELAIPDRVMTEMMECIEDRFPEMGSLLWEMVDTAGNAAAFQFPGLVIHDEDDPIVPVNQGRMVAEAWANSKMYLTRGLGHHRILRDPEVVKRVAEFVAAS